MRRGRGRGLTRRSLLRGAFAGGAAIGAAALMAACEVASSRPSPVPSTAAPLAAPETPTVRIASVAACDPWAWMCEPYLRDEGFTDAQIWASKDADLWADYAHHHVTSVDAGASIVTLAGLHTGCIQVWARPGIATFADLRGKTIAVGPKVGRYEGVMTLTLFYGFWMALFGHAGIQPSEATFLEIGDNFGVTDELLQGKADAILTVAAQGPILRAAAHDRARILLDGSADKPWSQQVCCVLVARRSWVKANPVAAKRATRAILRTLDDLERDRAVAARSAVEKGLFKTNPAFKDLSTVEAERVILDVNEHAHLDWREYDPAETLRFYALRLRDSKLITKAPQQIVDDGAQFTYMRQLAKELKP